MGLNFRSFSPQFGADLVHDARVVSLSNHPDF
jgi:hypothetical protein